MRRQERLANVRKNETRKNEIRNNGISTKNALRMLGECSANAQRMLGRRKPGNFKVEIRIAGLRIRRDVAGNLAKDFIEIVLTQFGCS